MPYHRFVNGYLAEQSFEILVAALQAAKSPLRELDIRNNELQDTGMKLLLTGLGSPECKLEVLKCVIFEIQPKLQ